MDISEDVASKLTGYYVNHRGIWRDLFRIRAVIAHLDDYSDQDLQALRKWYELHRDIVVEHHLAEDEFFFPQIAQHIGADSHLFERMVEEHHEMDRVIEKLDAAFAKSDRTHLEGYFKQYADLVEHHLKHEEKQFVPIAERQLNHQWSSRAESFFLHRMPMKKKIQALAWALEDMDDIVRRHFWPKLPFPAKLLYKFKLKKDYERLVQAAIR